MVPENILGLPAHPLIVHAPIALIPITGIFAIAMVVRPALRHSLGWFTVGLSLLSVILVQLALDSGESLSKRVPRTALIDAHYDLTGAIRPLAIGLFVALLAFVLVDRWLRQKSTGTKLSIAPIEKTVAILVSVLLVFAVVSTNYRLYEVGHSGAKAVWGDIPPAKK